MSHGSCGSQVGAFPPGKGEEIAAELLLVTDPSVSPSEDPDQSGQVETRGLRPLGA